MAKKKIVKPKKKATALRRKQVRSYSKPGKGKVEIGRFCIRATWEESGDKEMYDAKVRQGEGAKGQR